MRKLSHIIQDPAGLHARKAALLVREVMNHESDVRIKLGEKSADGRNLMDLMGLYAARGHCLEVEISGEDEEAACRGIKEILEESL